MEEKGCVHDGLRVLRERMAEAGRNGILVAMVVSRGSVDEGKKKSRRKLQEAIGIVSQKWHRPGQQQTVIDLLS